MLYLCMAKHRDMLQAGVELYNYMDTFFCCTVTSKKEFESVITEHMLVYVISGELDVVGRERRRHLQRGQAYLIRHEYALKIDDEPRYRSASPYVMLP